MEVDAVGNRIGGGVDVDSVVRQVCPSCGQDVDASDRYCRACGAQLAARTGDERRRAQVVWAARALLVVVTLVLLMIAVAQLAAE